MPQAMNDDNTTSTEDYLDEKVQIKDPITKQTIEIDKKLKQTIEVMIDLARKDAKKKVESRYKGLDEELTRMSAENISIKEALQRIEDSSLSEIDQAKNQHKRDIEKVKKDLEQATKQAELATNNFHKYLKENEIYKSFGDYKLSNSAHAARLFMDEADIVINEVFNASGEKTGEHKVSAKAQIIEDGKLKEVEGEVSEVFGKWVSQASNKYLLQNSLAAGGGSTSSQVPGELKGIDKLKTEYDAAVQAGDGIKMFQLKEQMIKAQKELNGG